MRLLFPNQTHAGFLETLAQFGFRDNAAGHEELMEIYLDDHEDYMADSIEAAPDWYEVSAEELDLIRRHDADDHRPVDYIKFVSYDAATNSFTVEVKP